MAALEQALMFWLIRARRLDQSKQRASMQQKSGLKYMVLEKKITAMREELDIKDAQMHEIVKVSQSSDKGKMR